MLENTWGVFCQGPPGRVNLFHPICDGNNRSILTILTSLERASSSARLYRTLLSCVLEAHGVIATAKGLVFGKFWYNIFQRRQRGQIKSDWDDFCSVESIRLSSTITIRTVRHFHEALAEKWLRSVSQVTPGDLLGVTWQVTP